MELTEKQINEIKNAIITIADELKKIIYTIRDSLLQIFTHIDWKSLRKIMKYLGIYKRTKKSRIKKKQFKLIMRLLE